MTMMTGGSSTRTRTNEYENPWDNEEEYAQTEEAHELYPTVTDYEEEHHGADYQEASQGQEDELDEDDQDNYE